MRAIYDCSEIKPAPDKYQGWGGVSLDRLFRSSSHYYWYDQGTVFTPSSGPWTKTLTITDNSEKVSVALVWTDRAAGIEVNTNLNLVNDLNLVVHMGESIYAGNNYYITPCDSTRDGYSLQYDENSEWDYDAKNNVERVDIRSTQIGDTTQLTLEVNVGSVSGDALEPMCRGACQPRQDFAIFVVNAHE